jgi:taurine dioxygenase
MTALTSYGSFSWTPICETFGAVVDLDLNKPLDDQACADLKDLFEQRNMILFRDQDIDYDVQRRTVALFGELLPESGDAKYVSTVHDVAGNPVAQPRDIDPRATEFHSDLTFVQSIPIRGISLFGEDVMDNATYVEGTRFLSARQALLNLSEQDRAALKTMRSIHLHALGLSVDEQKALRRQPFESVKDQVDFHAEHPLIHSSNGGDILFYIPWFAHSIVGLSADESQAWFDKFDKALYQDNLIYTHKWKQHDLLVWNNVALQHGKEPTPAGVTTVPKRVLRRAVLGVEAPGIYKAGDSYESSRAKRAS